MSLSSSPSSPRPLNIASLITTIPELVSSYIARQSNLLSKYQDPIAIGHDNDGLRRYRILGQVVEYDPIDGILIVEDFEDLLSMSENEQDRYCAQALLHLRERSPHQRYQLNVSIANVVHDPRFDVSCTRRGMWINVLGRLTLNEKIATEHGSELELDASIIWECSTVKLDGTRALVRELVRQRELSSRSPLC
ncbi:uncharacterized protein V2V93DRAFT_322143 [Kockiozyma suomiensis]|uniref:uncharacterized protein n=1 Tax=Kockiozyma suomiensis TaxID=1337062 RepID=UPI00334327BE